MPALHLSQNPEADALLSKDPLALVIGMVLDQQIPLEWAFTGPAELRRRLGRDLDAHDLASMDPEALAKAFSTTPALHRYPGSMAARVQSLAALVDERYGGHVERVWTEADSGADLVRRLRELPGFGEQKAKIFGALLAKQLDVRPDGWQQATSPFGDPGTTMSVADIVGEDSLARVRAYKQQLKAAKKAAAGASATSATAGRAKTGKKAASNRQAASSKKPASSPKAASSTKAASSKKAAARRA